MLHYVSFVLSGTRLWQVIAWGKRTNLTASVYLRRYVSPRGWSIHVKRYYPIASTLNFRPACLKGSSWPEIANNVRLLLDGSHFSLQLKPIVLGVRESGGKIRFQTRKGTEGNSNFGSWLYELLKIGNQKQHPLTNWMVTAIKERTE